MLKLTQELFGSDDSEFKRWQQQRGSNYRRCWTCSSYFNGVTASRREHPTDDLASAIANARIDGEPLSDIETVSYYLIVATAGHDTTSATISGGHAGLVENPDQRHRLRDDPGLMPLGHRRDDPMDHSGQGIHADRRRGHRGARRADRAGESLLLSYVSGNRDEDVFERPVPLRCRPRPQQALAFGYGVHFCLGAALARMEVSSFFSELVPRLESIELTGDPELIATTFVGGLKHLPVRYSLR